jgi:hypothetical protein
VYIKNKVTLLLQTFLQAPVTLSERHLEKKTEGYRAARVVGDLELSGFSPGVSQRELRELEGRFAETELLCS